MITFDPNLAPTTVNQLSDVITHPVYDRLAAYDPTTVFSRIKPTLMDPAVVVGSCTATWKFPDVTVRTKLGRMVTFFRDTSCTCCGLEGTVFVLERTIADTRKGPCLALYGVRDGQMIQLTVDHILPDSMNGKYATSNFRTMCVHCNRGRGCNMTQDEIDFVRPRVEQLSKVGTDLHLLNQILNLCERTLSQSADEARQMRQLLADARKHLSPRYSDADRASMIKTIQTYLNPSRWMRVKRGVALLITRARRSIVGLLS